MSRTNDNEYRYFGSDLNKFVNERCSKLMTFINIDLLVFKRTKRRIRIIEYKHSKENMPNSQFEVLKIFSKLIPPKFYKLDVFIVRGNEPYDDVEVYNFLTGKTYHIHSQDDFIEWLEFISEIEEVSY